MNVSTPVRRITSGSGDLEFSLKLNTVNKIAAASSPPQTPSSSQFADAISSAMSTLVSTYQSIGYTASEIDQRKHQVLSMIDATINQVSTSVAQEKHAITSECAWLRQQILVFLAMVDDARGSRLSRIDRGLLFEDFAEYEAGVLEDRANTRPREDDDREYLEVDISSAPAEALENDEVVVSPPSLLETKRRLHQVFSRVAQMFVRVFSQFCLSLSEYWEAALAVDWKPQAIALDQLLSREAVAEYQQVLEDYDELLTEGGMMGIEVVEASPQKARLEECRFTTTQPLHPLNPATTASVGDRFKQVNYKLVVIVRHLPMSKITDGIIAAIVQETAAATAVVATREAEVRQVIDRCFDVIDRLELTDNQLKQLQQRQNLVRCASDDSESTLGSGGGVSRAASEPPEDSFLDRSTLQYIHRDPSQLGLFESHLQFLTKFCQVLEKLSAKTEKHRELLVKQCRNLWKKLEIHHTFINDFCEQNQGLSDRAVAGWKSELERLRKERTNNIDRFIDSCRAEIEKLWEGLFYSHLQKSEWKYHQDRNANGDCTRALLDETTEEKETILHEYEEYTEKLQEEYEAKKEVLDIYAELRTLMADKQFLLESSKDSSRLLSKNSCKILLEEERTRKRINKNMPRVIGDLKRLVAGYEGVFLVNDEPLMAIITKIEGEESTRRSPTKTMSPQRSPGRVQQSPIRKRPPVSALPTPARLSRTRSPSPVRSPTRAISARVRPSPSKSTKPHLPPLTRPLAPLQPITNRVTKTTKQAAKTDSYEDWRQQQLQKYRENYG